MNAAFLVSTGVVAVAEIGDKTQLLSLLLVARFKKPWPIAAGILAATLANHALAALLGGWVSERLNPDALRWAVGLSLLAVAGWVLKPDRIDADVRQAGRCGVFVIALVAFFIAEIGDKTQIATVVLAAQYHALLVVVLGTTTGMMIANLPVVLLGNAFAHRVPLPAVRATAALLFAILGVLALAGVQP